MSQMFSDLKYEYVTRPDTSTLVQRPATGQCTDTVNSRTVLLHRSQADVGVVSYKSRTIA